MLKEVGPWAYALLVAFQSNPNDLPIPVDSLSILPLFFNMLDGMNFKMDIDLV